MSFRNQFRDGVHRKLKYSLIYFAIFCSSAKAMASLVRISWLIALFALVILNCMLLTSYLSMQPIMNMVALQKSVNEPAEKSTRHVFDTLAPSSSQVVSGQS